MNIFSFLRLKSDWNKHPEKNIIMFSEGNIYKFTNIPILKKLSEKEIIYYITLDKKDDIYLDPPKNVYVFLIELDFFGLLFLQTLKAKLFITTTPGLDVLALKRSRDVNHYSYFMHAPVEINYYQKNSFDYFDSIVCAGDFQINTLAKLEKKRLTSCKEKVSLGVAYYDEYNHLYKNSIDSSGLKTILIAPSWGGNNFLNIIDYDPFEMLLQAGYKIIFRPHPQSFIAEKLLLDKYKIHEKNPNFELNKDISIIPSFEKSDLLISGFSGIIFDFAYITERPCIIFNFEHNDTDIYESIDIDEYNFENSEMYKLGKVINATDKFNILEVINNINLEEYKKNIEESKKRISNFGNSAEQISNFFLTKI